MGLVHKPIRAAFWPAARTSPSVTSVVLWPGQMAPKRMERLAWPCALLLSDVEVWSVDMLFNKIITRSGRYGRVTSSVIPGSMPTSFKLLMSGQGVPFSVPVIILEFLIVS